MTPPDDYSPALEAEAADNSLAQRLWRLLGVLYWLVATVLHLICIYPFLDAEAQRQATCRHARRFLDTLHAAVQVDGPLPPHWHGTLVAANHVSWLDILALMTLAPMSFIAKEDIARWPVVGKMARAVNTVFIERGNHRDALRISQAMQARLIAGATVAFFPEGYTTDGMHILPFRAGLFQAALNANARVQPVALRYYNTQGARTRRASFAGAIGLVRSAWLIFGIRRLTIQITLLPVLYPDEIDQTYNRFTLVKEIENLMRPVIEDTAKAA